MKILPGLFAFHPAASSSALGPPSARNGALPLLALFQTLLTLFFYLQNTLVPGQVLSEWRPLATLYMKSGASDGAIRTVWHSLATHPGIASFKSSSPTEELARLAAQGPLTELIKNLDHNPLPHTFTALPRVLDPTELVDLAQQFQSWPQVERVYIDLDWARRLQAALALGRRGAQTGVGLSLLGLAILGYQLRRVKTRTSAGSTSLQPMSAVAILGDLLGSWTLGWAGSVIIMFLLGLALKTPLVQLWASWQPGLSLAIPSGGQLVRLFGLSGLAQGAGTLLALRALRRPDRPLPPQAPREPTLAQQ